MKKSIRILIFFLVLLNVSYSAASWDIITEDDFDGNMINQPYWVFFGDIEVKNSDFGNGSNKLAFNISGNMGPNDYDQIGYYMYENHIFINFDIGTDGLIGTNSAFTIFVDTPIVHCLIFNGNGSISVRNGGGQKVTLWGKSAEIGTFSDKKFVHVDMNFDAQNDRWDIYLDNKLIYTDTIDCTHIEKVRFSHGLISSTDQVDFEATSYIDNLKIVEASNVSILVPPDGTKLTQSSQNFRWSANPDVTEWRLSLGAEAGKTDIYDSGSLGDNTSIMVDGLPIDGSSIYARLWYLVGRSDVDPQGYWLFVDQAYNVPITTPSIITPLNGATIKYPQTFTWSANGKDVTFLQFRLGTSVGSSDIYLQEGLSGESTTLIRDLNHKIIYARLVYGFNGEAYASDYAYYAPHPNIIPSVLQLLLP